MPLTPEERSLRAAIGAHASWARRTSPEQRRARTAPAYDATIERFARQVDPEGELPPEQRRLAALSALGEHYARMRLKAAISRRKAKEARAAARAAERELSKLKRAGGAS